MVISDATVKLSPVIHPVTEGAEVADLDDKLVWGRFLKFQRGLTLCYLPLDVHIRLSKYLNLCATFNVPMVCPYRGTLINKLWKK